MAHTAIQKALKQIKAHSQYKNIHYQSACDKAIQILTDLLPYERETIEDAFEDGNQNGSTYPQGFCGDATSKYDYFTKTYNQND